MSSSADEAARGEHGSGPLPRQATLIDVRSVSEYLSGHLPGAMSLPLPSIEQEIVHKLPLRATPLILYCASGARSEQALGLLQQLGYTEVHNGGGAVHLAAQLGVQLLAGL
ncbi:MAG: rhodanese-like domain-containing protein [Pelomonas sp.]|nr:rhodanese-like domain-containing protein [Roseateles sp.]